MKHHDQYDYSRLDYIQVLENNVYAPQILEPIIKSHLSMHHLPKRQIHFGQAYRKLVLVQRYQWHGHTGDDVVDVFYCAVPVDNIQTQTWCYNGATVHVRRATKVQHKQPPHSSGCAHALGMQPMIQLSMENANSRYVVVRWYVIRTRQRMG